MTNAIIWPSRGPAVPQRSMHWQRVDRGDAVTETSVVRPGDFGKESSLVGAGERIRTADRPLTRSIALSAVQTCDNGSH
jgi:hypothetical protein